jgi:predicted cytidylate kinase
MNKVWIAISGFTASGKTTVGEILAKRLGVAHLHPSFKDWAKEEGIDLLSFQEQAEENEAIDKKFDDFVREEAKKQPCVASTWLSPWTVEKAQLRIFLTCPLSIRIARICEREGMDEDEAREYIKKKDESNFLRYKKLYDIDFLNVETYSFFDMMINSSIYSPSQICDMILYALNKKGGV